MSAHTIFHILEWGDLWEDAGAVDILQWIRGNKHLQLGEWRELFPTRLWWFWDDNSVLLAWIDKFKEIHMYLLKFNWYLNSNLEPLATLNRGEKAWFACQAGQLACWGISGQWFCIRPLLPFLHIENHDGIQLWTLPWMGFITDTWWFQPYPKNTCKIRAKYVQNTYFTRTPKRTRTRGVLLRTRGVLFRTKVRTKYVIPPYFGYPDFWWFWGSFWWGNYALAATLQLFLADNLPSSKQVLDIFCLKAFGLQFGAVGGNSVPSHLLIAWVVQKMASTGPCHQNSGAALSLRRVTNKCWR